MRGLSTADTLVFLVVNVTAVAQTIGFLSRPSGPAVQSAMGVVIMLMAVPAAAALLLDRSTANVVRYAGIVMFVAFALMELVVDYILDVEFRDPRDAAVLIPYLVLFYGSILLMGLSLFRVSLVLWGVTAVTCAALLAATVWAQVRGFG